MTKKAFEIIAAIEHKRADWYWLYREFPKYVYLNKKMIDIIKWFYGRDYLVDVCGLKVEIDNDIKKVKDIWIR